MFLRFHTKESNSGVPHTYGYEKFYCKFALFDTHQNNNIDRFKF